MLPSLEAFEKGVRLPKLHYIFQDNFVRSCVGEDDWKESMKSNNLGERLAPVQDQSMAMLFLENYYFSWLLEAKLDYKEMGPLVTDYDTTAMQRDMGYLTDRVLPDIRLDITQQEVQDGFEEEEEGGTPTSRVSYEHVIVCKDDAHNGNGEESRKFKELRTKTKKTIDQLRKELRNHTEYKQVLRKLKEIQEEDNDGEEISKRNGKRRKLIMSLRKYTNGGNQEQGKYKGWSTAAASEMIQLSRNLKDEESKEEVRAFNAAYRMIKKKGLEKKGKNKRKREEAVVVEYEKDLWDLPDDLPVVEI